MKTTLPERRACPACGGRGERIPRYASVDLDRCERCGLTFLGSPEAVGIEDKYPSDEYTDANQDYFSADRAFTHMAAVRLRWLSSRVGRGAVLELGPGSGHFLAAARDAGFEVLGVEPSPALAERITADFGVPVEAGFVADLDLPAGHFDLACLFHVLEHTEDPVGTLASLRPLLKPDGLLAIEVPNIASAMAVRRGEAWVGVRPERLHVSQFAPETLVPVVERAGFDVVAVDTVPPWRYLEPSARLRARALMGYGFRALRLRTLRTVHPTGFDNLRLLARPDGAA